MLLAVQWARQDMAKREAQAEVTSLRKYGKRILTCASQAHNKAVARQRTAVQLAAADTQRQAAEDLLQQTQALLRQVPAQLRQLFTTKPDFIAGDGKSRAVGGANFAAPGASAAKTAQDAVNGCRLGQRLVPVDALHSNLPYRRQVCAHVLCQGISTSFVRRSTNQAASLSGVLQQRHAPPCSSGSGSRPPRGSTAARAHAGSVVARPQRRNATTAHRSGQS